MGWIKTCEGEYVNLNYYFKFCFYSIETDEKFYGVKISLKDEKENEKLVGYFSTLEEAEAYVKLAITAPSLTLNHYFVRLHDLVEAEHPDAIFAWKWEEEEWETFDKRRKDLIKSLNIREEEFSP